MNPLQKLISFIKPPTERKAVVSNRAEPFNVSSTATASSIQSAIRQAEAGDTRQLFALYRDVLLGDDHIQGEFNKRKLAVLAQPIAILPQDKSNKDDLLAAQAVIQMIADCGNWTNGLTHLLSSTLWPLSMVEKIFQPAPVPRPGQVRLQYTLKKLEVVNPTLFCFREKYASLPGKANDATGEGTEPLWEPDVRLYATDEYGNIIWGDTKTYYPDPTRHMVHRGHLLVDTRDNWGGPMRSVLGWWLLSQLARDWFGRFMERFGNPFIVARTDSADSQAVSFLENALSLATKVGGMVVDHETVIELKEAAVAGGAEGYKTFLNVCTSRISKVIVGQDLSATAAPTGMGSGVADFQSNVREDIRMFDQMKLGETLRNQLFIPFLQFNGLRGAPPKAVWGGLGDEDAKTFADLLVSLSQGGFEPTDEALPTISDRLGFPVQRKAVVAPSFGSPYATPFSASLPLLKVTHPSDVVAARKAKLLGDAFRGAHAPVREILLRSTSPEDFEKQLALFYADWNPQRVHQVAEEALQLCAAEGAVAGKR